MKRQKYLSPLVVRLLLFLSISTSLIQLMKDTFPVQHSGGGKPWATVILVDQSLVIKEAYEAKDCTFLRKKYALKTIEDGVNTSICKVFLFVVPW